MPLHPKGTLFPCKQALSLLTVARTTVLNSSFLPSPLSNYFRRFIQDFRSSPLFLVFKNFVSRFPFFHPTLGFYTFFSNFFNWWARRSRYTWLCFHSAERFCVIFLDVHKKTRKRKEFEQFGLKNTKNMWRTFGAEVHESSIRVERWHNNYEILIKIENTRLFFKRFSYQVQSYCITDL